MNDPRDDQRWRDARRAYDLRRDPTALARMAGPPLPDDPELRAHLLAMTGDSSEYDRLRGGR